MKKKHLALFLSVAMMIGCAIGGTIAWLVDSHTITNTFTASNIDIELTESDDLDLKMVPGEDITKDPEITVLKGSEACWLFVEIDKSSNYDKYLEDYTIDPAGNWIKGNGTDIPENVYYKSIPFSDKNLTVGVLKDDKVTVKESATKAYMDEIKTDDDKPTLTFTAYAVQQASFDTAALAWGEALKIND